MIFCYYNDDLNLFYFTVFKYFFKFPGIFFPWTFVFAAITVATYLFLTPSLETMKTFEIGWISYIFFRNAVIILLWTGFFHLRLKTQGTSFKYNPRPLEKNNSTFYLMIRLKIIYSILFVVLFHYGQLMK